MSSINIAQYSSSRSAPYLLMFWGTKNALRPRVRELPNLYSFLTTWYLSAWGNENLSQRWCPRFPRASCTGRVTKKKSAEMKVVVETMTTTPTLKRMTTNGTSGYCWSFVNKRILQKMRFSTSLGCCGCYGLAIMWIKGSRKQAFDGFSVNRVRHAPQLLCWVARAVLCMG